MEFETAVHSVEEPTLGISSPNTPATTFQICDNGDLRDRHQRRRIEAAGQSRLPKRKSCKTEEACHYPATSLLPRIADPHGISPASSSLVASSRPGQARPIPSSVDQNVMGTSDTPRHDVPHPDTYDTFSLTMTGKQCNATYSHFDPITATGCNPFGASNVDSIMQAMDGSLFSSGTSLRWGDDLTPLSDPMPVENVLTGGLETSINPRLSLPLNEISRPVGPLETRQPEALPASAYNAHCAYNLLLPSVPSSNSHYWGIHSRGENNDLAQRLLRGDIFCG
ncbi:hypothetical protein ANOM_009846 [Aspergillus nomiae NRRL 13137]|uniref:Uncharacterized protein n=1 Tax=Aspergillus nomiae NRRL (strain ATCC 15546 / NRRL 13137 / CBS 260.88 / M93) TaxID=1509407 RepID=A0A0L1IZH6_ASPN3|nr:uncharacterized protein ANOM_009846 [Aspergillus nomiae NRRL 13137]KNG84825.1 hypothetical protein ANOM_009846 [Aspergillus nomiae NRRL 13137]